MSLDSKIKNAYLLRGKENFRKNHKDPQDNSWLEGVLGDFKKAAANEEMANFAEWCIEKEHYDMAIRAYQSSANFAGLISLGKSIFEEVKTKLDQINSEEGDDLISEQRRIENTINLIYHAVDALATINTSQEAKTLIEGMADLAFEYDKKDLYLYVLEKGGHFDKLTRMGDKAIVGGKLDEASNLYEKGQRPDKLNYAGDLFAAEGEYEKAAKVFRKTEHKEGLKSLKELMGEEKDLSLNDLVLFCEICQEVEKDIPADKLERLYTLSLSKKDPGVLIFAIKVLSDAEKLENIGDLCKEIGSYDLAISAYQKADGLKK